VNSGFHYFAPWWALLSWLAFGPRPRIDGRTLAWAVLWPMLWIGYTLAHWAVTDWYPYPFTDATQIGYVAAVRNLLVVVLIAVLLGAVLRLLDRRLPAAVPRAEPANAAQDDRREPQAAQPPQSHRSPGT
jgi:hypothetical protein